MTNSLPKISTHLGYFGSGGDRYNPDGYRNAVSPAERIRLASKVRGLDGVELNYPALVNEETVDEISSVLAETGLAVSNVSINLWGTRKWGLGSLSSPDPTIRAEALQTLKRGIDVSRAVGSPLVSLWAGQDGFDYPFQIDYGAAYDCFIQGMRQAADHDPGMRICLEYKPKEPRTHLLVDTAARTMWIVGKIGAPNVGVLLDVGHAFFAYENVAQSAALLQRERLLDILHFNDNYGEWDWDMIPGTVRFWEHIELIFWLRELGYDKWYSIDITMPRGDAVKACQQSVTNIQRLYLLAKKLERETILSNLKRTDHPENLRVISDTIFDTLGA
jgi:sugar phosphate isomerase/epimerase